MILAKLYTRKPLFLMASSIMGLLVMVSFNTCTTLIPIEEQQVCDDVGYAISSKIFQCTGDHSLANKAYKNFSGNFFCNESVLGADLRAKDLRDVYACSEAIMQHSCDRVIEYKDDVNKYLDLSGQCATIIVNEKPSSSGGGNYLPNQSEFLCKDDSRSIVFSSEPVYGQVNGKPFENFLVNPEKQLSIDFWLRTQEVTDSMKIMGMSQTMLEYADGKQQWFIQLRSAEPDECSGDACIEIQFLFHSFRQTTDFSVFTTADDAWHHIAITQPLFIYVDGVFSGNNGTLPATASYKIDPWTTPLFIGSGSNKGEAVDFFKGRIDQLRIWSTNIAGATLFARRNAPLTKEVREISSEKLLGEWLFNELQNTNEISSTTGIDTKLTLTNGYTQKGAILLENDCYSDPAPRSSSAPDSATETTSTDTTIVKKCYNLNQGLLFKDSKDVALTATPISSVMKDISGNGPDLKIERLDNIIEVSNKEVTCSE